MTPDAVNPAAVRDAVDAFNSIYGEMDAALWRISRAARDCLLVGRDSPVLPGLVWTIKSWWGVQFVRGEIADITAQALLAQEWKGDLFEPTLAPRPEAERFAPDRVTRLVSDMLARGAGRREFSLASKTLHWLMPWRVPVYDSFVRRSLGISENIRDDDAYRQIVRTQMRDAALLAVSGSDWTGEVEPRSPLRALDKYLWWAGGGMTSHAAVVNAPWAIVDRLGLSRD